MPRANTATRTTKETPLSPFPDGSVPAWEVAYLFPAQGAWSETAYWALENRCEGAARVELSNGRLEVLTVPTELHQLILLFLMETLKAFTDAHSPGMVLFCGIKVRLRARS
jgi:hypothetical protein